MSDYISTAIGAEGQVRIICADTTETVRKALEIHKTSPVATAALGRLLTGGILLSKQMKNEQDSLTLQIKGRGVLGGLTAVCTASAQVRGYVENPHADLPLNQEGKLDVGGAVGKGFLSVIKDMGLKEPYLGTTALISGEIAEDLSYYLASSEQIPSAIALGVLIVPAPESEIGYEVACAGGYMLQIMPGASDTLITDLERQIRCLPPLTTMMNAGATVINITEDLLAGYSYEFKESNPCSYTCTCSPGKMEAALIAAGPEEIADILQKEKQAELYCKFCNTSYVFDEEKLKKILERMNL